jgi:peroxiredoxin
MPTPSAVSAHVLVLAACSLCFGWQAPATQPASTPAASNPPASPAKPTPAPEAPKPALPGLSVGDKAPDATLTAPDGTTAKLSDFIKEGPIVVVFYRGGWCPFCVKHLSAWRSAAADVKAAGGTLVAITPERPQGTADTIKKNDLGYRVFSDTNLDAAKGFKLLFELDEETQRKYRGYGIDLSIRNAAKAWSLPHPGTFVVDKSGTVRYAAADKDYSKRTDPSAAVAALKALKPASNADAPTPPAAPATPANPPKK